MAKDVIKRQNSIGAFYPVTIHSSLAGLGAFTFFRYGKLVIGHGFRVCTAAIPAQEVLFTLPTNYTYTAQGNILVMSIENSNKYFTYNLYENGEVKSALAVPTGTYEFWIITSVK